MVLCYCLSSCLKDNLCYLQGKMSRIMRTAQQEMVSSLCGSFSDSFFYLFYVFMMSILKDTAFKPTEIENLLNNALVLFQIKYPSKQLL